MVAGIIGGLGAYSGVDPTLLRVIFVLLTIISFGIPGVILYAVLIFVIPEEPKKNASDEDDRGPEFRPWD